MYISRRKFGACLLAGAAARHAFGLLPRPKLLILLIVQQFRPDYLDSVINQLGEEGLRRLVEKGAYFPACRNLASSYSSSSLATLATGAWPAQHGIVADRWYDRATRKPVRASAETLLATTLSSEVAGASNTRTFVISLGAPEAELFAGNSDADLYWIDSDGHFTTDGDTPAWLTNYNRQKPIENLHDASWLAVGAAAGAPALRTLKFNPGQPQEFFELYRASPFAQSAQFEFLAELVTREKLGQGNTFDFVCLLAGSTEILGYETGAQSPLMRQMTLQLDRHVAFLLRQLERAAGPAGYNLVFAGAHGAPEDPVPEARSQMAVNGELLAQAIQQKLGADSLGRVERYLCPFVYLDTKGFLDPEPMRITAGRAALEQEAVAAYFTAGGACSIHDGWAERFRNSFHPARAGDLMLAYQAEYIEDNGAGRGVSYGSLYNYDIQTPLCFYGPQFRAGVFETPVELVDVAPTLARAMGVAAPSSSTGRVLGEAFAEEKPK